MDYKKKIREYMVSSKVDQLYKSMLINLFPELAESDDERIRKEIKAFIKSRGSQITQSKTDGWLAWLKKQGEHAKFCDSIQVGDKVTKNQYGVLVNLSQLKRVAKPSDDIDTEKQRENTYNKELSELLHKVICRFINAPDIPYSDREKVSMEVLPYVERLEKQGEQKQPKELTNSEFVEKCKGLSRLEQHILALVPTRPIDAIKVDARTVRYLVEQEQGEQKPETVPKFRVGDRIKYITDSADIREIQEIDVEKGIYYCENINVLFDEQDDWELVEQKPAWSEEDETGLGDALWAIQQARTIAKDENDMGNLWYAERWLKSLKEKVQPKQEWSEEADYRIRWIISLLTTMQEKGIDDRFGDSVPDDIPDIIAWLKSLRPQKQWKPSEESFNNTSCTCLSKKEAESKVWKQ